MLNFFCQIAGFPSGWFLCFLWVLFCPEAHEVWHTLPTDPRLGEAWLTECPRGQSMFGETAQQHRMVGLMGPLEIPQSTQSSCSMPEGTQVGLRCSTWKEIPCLYGQLWQGSAALTAHQFSLTSQAVPPVTWPFLPLLHTAQHCPKPAQVIPPPVPSRSECNRQPLPAGPTASQNTQLPPS